MSSDKQQELAELMEDIHEKVVDFANKHHPDDFERQINSAIGVFMCAIMSLITHNLPKESQVDAARQISKKFIGIIERKSKKFGQD